MKTQTLFILLVISLFLSCSKTSDELEKNIIVSVSARETVIYNGVETIFSATTSEVVFEVSFYLDGQNIGSLLSQPYNLKYTPKDIAPGVHEIKCVAKTENGKTYSGQTTITINLRLGDEYQGGKIFYLDSSTKHGLIASKSDMVYSGNNGDVVRFAWGSETILGTSNDNGKLNTQLMASNATSPSSAGYHFKNGGYSHNGYVDWYIPSINELELLKENKSYVGGFSTASDWQAMYWSSSESNQTMAFILNFNVLMGNTNDKIKVYKIRPIRSF